jgi:uncharacterized protein (TIGR03000 family)
MLRKLFFAPLLLSVASLLAVTGFADAQRHGGGHGGGRGGGHVSHGGGYHGGYRGGYNRGGYNGGYRSGYNRGGYYSGYGGYNRGGLLGGLLGGYGYGYGYPYRNSYYSNYRPGLYSGYGYSYGYPGYGGYSYAYPSTSNYYAAPIYYDEAAPSTVSTMIDQTAHIRVLLPNAQARVWFDGAVTQQTGTARTFHTPALSSGVTNQYRVRASWMEGMREVVQERVVSVMPGQEAVVDFRNSI